MKKINLNRLGSNPAEHIFDFLKMKSRYKHIFEKMEKKISETELQKQFLSELGEDQPISGRKVITETKDIFEFSPCDCSLIEIQEYQKAIQRPDFIYTATFRQQVGILCEHLHNNYIKISYDQIGKIFE